MTPRGKIIGKQVGGPPLSDTDHFWKCEACGGRFDMRDLRGVRSRGAAAAYVLRSSAVASQDNQCSVVMRRRDERRKHSAFQVSRTPRGPAERAPLNSPPCCSLRCPLCRHYGPKSDIAPSPKSAKRAISSVGRLLPVYPDKQTFSESVGMSQRCQKPTWRWACSITSSARARIRGGMIGY
jgi:hypothetical protein